MVFFIVFILIHLISLGIMIAAEYSMHSYIKKFRFERSQYDLLFGFIHLKHVMGAYALFTVAFTAYTVFFLIRYYG